MHSCARACWPTPRASLAGAGGGGFLLVVTRRPDARADLQACLGKLCLPGITFHSVEVDEEGLVVARGRAS